ncbi:MAG: DUF4340 domain-containing protein [Proteobacteria bacterium]|nr:DUF4340 domain-containing protein [Pseudomonadota bacterium]
MHSRNGLLVLSTLAAFLVAAVVIDSGRMKGPVSVSRRIIPELTGALASGEAIARITWKRSGIQPFSLMRDDTGEWVLVTDRSHAIAAGTAVNSAVVSDIVGTLELLSYVRTATGDPHTRAAGDRERSHLALHIELSTGQTVTLHLDQTVSAADRVWITRGNGRETAENTTALARRYLIDGYAARALDRNVADIRQHRLVRLSAESITAIELHAGDRELLIAGQPPAVYARSLFGSTTDSENIDSNTDTVTSSGHIRADPGAYTELVSALGALIIERFVPRRGDGLTSDAALPHGLTVRIVGGDQPVELVEIGACPEVDSSLRLVVTSLGSGCMPVSLLDRVRAFTRRGRDMLAKHLITRGDIEEIVIQIDAAGVSGAGSRRPAIHLVARGSAWSIRRSDWPDSIQQGSERPGHRTSPGDKSSAAEADAVARWLVDVERSTTGRYVSAPSITENSFQIAPRAIIEVMYRSGQPDRLAFFDHRDHGLVARRNREPAVMRVDVEPHAGRVLTAFARRFRRRQLLSAQPHGLREAISRRGKSVVTHLVRGELLDDWTARKPAGKKPKKPVIDALRALALLRAVAFVSEERRKQAGLDPARLRVEVAFDPGPLDSAGIRHILDIGRATTAGCHARLDGDPAVFVIDGQLCATLLGSWVE